MICGAPISRCARGRRGRGAAHLERARVDAEAVVLERVADVLGALAARERDADVRLPADRDRARDCARRVPEDEVHAVAAVQQVHDEPHEHDRAQRGHDEMHREVAAPAWSARRRRWRRRAQGAHLIQMRGSTLVTCAVFCAVTLTK
jgi:hypothetical protein